ncbi:MAG TPA: hypothetical protein VFU23_02210, partial [Gemmatimonadales bacterium]|nr:hypothetical protein [Gemmatimonadales bacterium]
MAMHLARVMTATTGILACLAAPSAAQTPCTAANLAGLMRISVGASFATPAGATRAFIPAAGAAAADPLSAPTGDRWTASAIDVTKLAAAQAGNRRTIEFAAATGSMCTREFAVSPDDAGAGPRDAPPPANTAVTMGFDGAEDCARIAGPRWETEIKASRRRQPGNFTLLIFLESGNGSDANICYYNRDYGVAGDPIYVGMFRKSFTWTAVRFEPCAIQAAAPNVLQSSDKFPSGLQAGEWKLQQFLPRRCFNTAVDVSVVGEDRGSAVTQRFPLSQYDRYRATVQAGILFTPQHDREFGLRADQADTSKKFIYDKGPSNRGPEYIATLQLYSVLRYLPSIFKKPAYPGRDPVNDQGLVD